MRLTQLHRAHIEASLLASQVDSRDEPLHQRYAKLARDCYERQYSDERRELMASLPEGWLLVSGYITVALASDGCVVHLSFNGRFPRLGYNCSSDVHREVVYLPFPVCDNGTCRLRLELSHPLHHAYDQLAADREALGRDRATLKAQVHATLARYRDVEKLLKEWPEVRPFVENIIGEASTPVVNLPAIPRQELNAALGLQEVVP